MAAVAAGGSNLSSDIDALRAEIQASMVVSDKKHAESLDLTAEILAKFVVVEHAITSRAERRAQLELRVHLFLNLVKEQIEKRTNGQVISVEMFDKIKNIMWERHSGKIIDAVQIIEQINKDGLLEPDGRTRNVFAFIQALSDSVVVQHEPSQESLFRFVQSKFIKGGRGKMRNSGGSSKKAGHRV